MYIIVFNFYLAGVRQATAGFYTANGLFKYFKVTAILEVIVNLVVSIVLAKIIGMNGVFIGTTISHISIKFWYEPYILFKHGLTGKVTEYFKKYSKYLIIFIVSIICTQFINSLIYNVTIANFLLKLFVAILIPNLLYIIIFRNTKEFKYILNLITNLKNKIFLKKSQISNKSDLL